MYIELLTAVNYIAREGGSKMKDSYYKKGLVLGILILFIGAGAIPSISGYTGKMNIQSTNEVPTNFPLNNEYVNSYWKFDEGSGTTAYDSSGHGYHGTIYGASWTTGQSNYALDFDGADDYVSLDTHAANLGINKTDDVIFSFWFKSTSTNNGLIYSTTGSGNIPEIRIELLANGSLIFRIWTTLCGIIIYSSDSYNDGDWHYGEIIFNGITSNPTIELYVDVDLEGSVTEWLCGIENDDFKNTKMGRRASDASAYFDGAIDDFKIIKYDGGNEQEPPIINGPTMGDPGVEYDFSFIINDPEGDDTELYIDWDDGDIEEWFGFFEPGEEVIVSHTWEEEGEYLIKARSRDRWHYSSWSEHLIRIGNQPPYPPTIDGRQYGDENEVLTYTFVTEDYEGSDVLYYVDWDDGTYKDWFGPFPSGQEVTATHAWTQEHDYYIEAKARDVSGIESDWTDPPYHVRIGDQPPDAPVIDGPNYIGPGVEHEYTFVTTDPEGDNVYYEIIWGDGDEEETGYHASGGVATVDHTWSESGDYKIEARAIDVLGNPGDWGRYHVSVPRNKAINFNLLELLFERFPYAFSILRHLLEL